MGERMDTDKERGGRSCGLAFLLCIRGSIVALDECWFGYITTVNAVGSLTLCSSRMKPRGTQKAAWSGQ